MTLTEFLEARIAEDEAVAREPWLHVLADVQRWWDSNEDEPGFFADDQPDDVKGLAKTLMQIERERGTYARVLADCEAKRSVVEDLARFLSVAVAAGAADDHPTLLAGLTLQIQRLALPYADHPDYDEEWRP